MNNTKKLIIFVFIVIFIYLILSKDNVKENFSDNVIVAIQNFLKGFATGENKDSGPVTREEASCTTPACIASNIKKRGSFLGASFFCK